MQKERIFYLDFIRAISVIGIVIFHFNTSIVSNKIKANEIFYNNYENGNLGGIGVSLFFIISGAALMYNYNQNYSIKEYFKKRIMGIYPMFWVAYIITFLYMFYINRGIATAPNYTFILTIFGFDGYMLYKIKNFYLVGEWFLGCIILLYLCFPFLRKLIIYKPKITFICITILYMILVQKYNLSMVINRNFFMRIPEFFIGMYFIQYIRKVNLYQFLISISVVLFMLFIKININQMYKITIIGIVLFIVLVYISEYIKLINIKKIFIIISRYSYAIFLVHHVIINQLAGSFKGMTLTRSETYCLFILICITISIFSVYLDKLTNNICKCIAKNIREFKEAN